MANSHFNEQIEQFFDSIEPFADAYRNDTFAYMAIRTRDGFVLVQGSLFLNIGKRNLPDADFVSNSIRVGHLSLDVLGLSRRDFVSRICSGAIDLPDVRLLFPPNSSSTYFAQRQEFHAEGLKAQSRLGVLTLFGKESRAHIDNESLNWELRAANVPFDGMVDLLNEYQLGSPRTGSNSLEIVALPVGVVDMRSHVEGETARLLVRIAPDLSPSKVLVGYRVLDNSRVVKRTNLPHSAFSWTVDGDVRLGSVEFDVPRAAVIQAFVTCGGVAQQFCWFGDPNTFQNPRRAAFEAVDVQLESFREILARARSQTRGASARDLEKVVAWLAWLLGFSTAHFGDLPKTQDAADLLLCTPNGHFAIVECTTGLLKADQKLSLLHARAQVLRRKLDESKMQHLRILPVIITTRTREDVRADIDQAERLGIWVLTYEDIERLLQSSLVAPVADQMYERAEAVVKTALDEHIEDSEE